MPSAVEWERKQAELQAQKDKQREVAKQRHEKYLKEIEQANKRQAKVEAEQRKQRAQNEADRKAREVAATRMADRLEQEQALRDRAQQILNERSGEGESSIRVPAATPWDVRR